MMLESDHDALVINRKMKIIPCEEEYIRYRNFKKINNDYINEDIINNENYNVTLDKKEQ